ncbi:MAG: shikimate kinase, partial [Dethiobacteria bacterium]
VLLCASPEEIYRRVGGLVRPLLAGEDPYGRIVELLSRREPLYRSFAAFTVLTDGKAPEEIAREICAAVKENL